MLEVPRIDGDISVLHDPGALFWQERPALKVPLVPAPEALQDSQYIRSQWQDGGYGQLSGLGFQAVHTGSHLLLRLEWEQPNEPLESSMRNGNDFPDAAALLFPLHEFAPIFMGDRRLPVSLWHWKDDGSELATLSVAEGIGSSAPLPEECVMTRARWQDGYWQLLFIRLLNGTGGSASHLDFAIDKPVRTGFAVWDGSRREHAGMKAFSPMWTEFVLQP